MKKVVTYTSRLTIALGISLILAIALGAGFSIWMLRLQEISKWEKQTETFSLVLAENTIQQMDFAYTALNSITERIEDRWSISAEFLTSQLANNDFHQFLKEKVTISPAIDVISVLDVNGNVINTSRNFPVPTYSLADRDYFIVQRDNPTQGVYLSSAVRSKSTGRWTFFLSQRLTGSDGEFIGIVMLGLSPVFYSRFYEKLHVGEHASIALMRNDFTYLARWPEHDDVIGKKNLSGSTYQVIHEQKKKAGVLIGTQPRMSYDNKVVTRLAAVQSLDKYPLIINFSVDEDMYLADWRKISIGVIVIALVCILAVMAGFAALVVLLRLREADMKITTELKQKAEVINRNQAGLLQSLTEQKKALTESSERLEAIFQNAPDGIIMIDDQGLIEALNPAAVAIYGYPPDEVVGRHGKQFSPPHQIDLLTLAMQQEEFLRTGRLHMEVERMRKGGSMFPAELSISEYFLLGKRKLIVIVRDISERRKIDKMKSEFISTVSHELRTPLTAIRGALGLVVGGAMGTLTDKMAPLLSIAYKNSESLTRLINDLLDIQKIEAGKMDFVYESVSVQSLLQTSVSSNQTLAHSLGVSIVFNSTNSDVMIQVDTGRFQQVMANLLSNACKYSPAGGVVRVVCQRPDEHHIRIEVIDRGSGVPEGFRAHLFEKFSQADASDTRAKGGTGLGLAISQAIVAQMRGDINYYMEHDSSGQSTHFYIEFSVVPAASPQV
ncbi:PAS domain S-box protein [Undibacterium sp. SXout7W]|uniref:PAS domain S-box protein n=1 Tax=Undibacterium sp. SXout7W TaxID=3413049 RepID=UPI003BF3FB82